MKPTNLLFILSDQHSRDALGAYGHPIVRTPNLDRLAEGGVRFNNAYTNCPICVPARASLATGRYVHQIGYWDNAFPYEGGVRGWGHRMIDAGHRVESIGKLHYRGLEGEAEGFSRQHIPLNVVGGVGDVMGAIRQDMPKRRGARQGILDAKGGTSGYLEYDERIAQAATRWLRDAARRPEGKPWMLFVGFVCPHPPFIAPPDLFDHYMRQDLPPPVQSSPEERPRHPILDKFRETFEYCEPFTPDEIRRVTAAYYGACAHLDRQVGQVLEALDDAELRDDTRVIYTSDHGESLGRRGLFGKFTMYEESAAVPFIMSGPDVPRGEVRDEIISLVDAAPTFLDALGLEPTEEDADRPGESLWPVANGAPFKGYALSEYHAVGSLAGCYMLREGRYKHIHYVGYAPQLFDLEADPLETTNLADDPAHRETLRALDARLRSILDPEATDARAKADQRALAERHGGRDAVIRRGTFTNSPVPGETPKFQSGA